jgi:hypothetical protein
MQPMRMDRECQSSHTNQAVPPQAIQADQDHEVGCRMIQSSSCSAPGSRCTSGDEQTRNLPEMPGGQQVAPACSPELAGEQRSGGSCDDRNANEDGVLARIATCHSEAPRPCAAPGGVMPNLRSAPRPQRPPSPGRPPRPPSPGDPAHPTSPTVRHLTVNETSRPTARDLAALHMGSNNMPPPILRGGSSPLHLALPSTMSKVAPSRAVSSTPIALPHLALPSRSPSHIPKLSQLSCQQSSHMSYSVSRNPLPTAIHGQGGACTAFNNVTAGQSRSNANTVALSVASSRRVPQHAGELSSLRYVLDRHQDRPGHVPVPGVTMIREGCPASVRASLCHDNGPSKHADGDPPSGQKTLSPAVHLSPSMPTVPLYDKRSAASEREVQLKERVRQETTEQVRVLTIFATIPAHGSNGSITLTL